MAGLLSGLEQFGLGNLEHMDLYESTQSSQGDAKQAAAPVVVQETDFLFDKTYSCPICDSEFKTRTVKIGKAK